MKRVSVTAATTVSLFVLVNPVTAAPVSPRAEKCTESTQSKLNECADAAFRKTDAALGAAYKEIPKRLNGDRSTLKLLIAAQRAWIGFRTAECTFTAAGVAGGSIHPMIVAECLADLSRKRLGDLELFLKCAEGDLNCPVPAP